MRPAFIDETEYNRLRDKARADIEGDSRVRMMLAVMPSIVEVGAAGIWLQDMADAGGASEDEVQALAFAHGQACFPNREPWATAQAMLQRWREGRAPKPGVTFADELLEGDVSDLPTGGARIMKAQ